MKTRVTSGILKATASIAAAHGRETLIFKAPALQPYPASLPTQQTRRPTAAPR
jgi:hypothetical protein